MTARMHASILLALAMLVALGQEAPATAAEPAKLPTPYDAVLVAAEFIVSVPPEDQPYIRFIYVQNPGDWKALSLAINGTLSSVGNMVLPQPVPIIEGPSQPASDEPRPASGGRKPA